jgi:hypothetical protein
MRTQKGVLVLAGLLGLVVTATASAQGPGCCGRRPPGKMQGGMRGGGMDADHQKDMELFHFLLDNGDRITRTVKQIPEGVETLTESEDPEIAAKIREHVRSMYDRVEEGRPIHLRDPLFAEIFDHADEIHMEMTETEKGLRVRETSENPYVVKLIQAHAEVVNRFVENGRAEMRKDHAVPER